MFFDAAFRGNDIVSDLPLTYYMIHMINTDKHQTKLPHLYLNGKTPFPDDTAHSAHRCSPSETRLCAAPDVESMEIAGASAALVTACATQSTNQSNRYTACRNLSQVRRVIQSQEREIFFSGAEGTEQESGRCSPPPPMSVTSRGCRAPSITRSVNRDL